MQAQRERIAQAYAARKSPLRLAWMLGLGTVFRFGLSFVFGPKVLRIADLEASVSRLLGGKARALLCSDPEIATDIDRASDLAALKNDN
jgi:hypothetical protein